MLAPPSGVRLKLKFWTSHCTAFSTWMWKHVYAQYFILNWWSTFNKPMARVIAQTRKKQHVETYAIKDAVVLDGKTLMDPFLHVTRVSLEPPLSEFYLPCFQFLNLRVLIKQHPPSSAVKWKTTLEMSSSIHPPLWSKYPQTNETWNFILS